MLKAPNENKSLRINIIPLIDIIFLMLVFFMLATNFSKNKEISFSINDQKQVSKNPNKEKLMIIYLKNNEIIFEKKKIDLETLEKKFFEKWDSFDFEKIVVLNDKKSQIQLLVSTLDVIKKNNIKNVNFSNEP